MRDDVLQLVQNTVRELSSDMGYDSLRSPNPATPLYGEASELDSLSLVMVVSAVETAVNDAFQSNVLLASESAMSMRNSPYRTVGTLAEFVEAELAKS